ncbi:MAG: FAD-dependent oxidoreductase [Propionicimonas sp.]|uniref:NAD(P)/FAD-dependent oxidoreductase n=1 Tax=Propionicimonas sp. TaxID=1955623 RepID=UPI003D0B4AFF
MAAVEIVVLGAGYCGLWTARRLGRRLRRRLADGSVHLTLVSEMDHHAFHGWTAEVITGDVLPEHARVPIAHLLPHPTTILHGSAVGIDLSDHTVEVVLDGTTRRLPWDQLVVAVGSKDARDRIDGLRAHGWSVKDDGQLAALNAHLGGLAAAAVDADPQEQRRLLTAVVAGGGLAGTEMAAAILQRLRDEVAARPGLAAAAAAGLPRVVLVHSHDRLVADLRPKVADYATARVLATGVEVRLNHRLAEVTADGAVLDDGTLLASATVLSALGQEVVRVAGTEALAHDDRGRLVTDDLLRTAAPGVWAGGDAAAVPQPRAAASCRSDALWAIAHGKHLGDNVARVVAGAEPVPFTFRGLGRAASLGVGHGAGELYGLDLVGWPSWLFRWAVFHWFMPSRRVAVATAVGWFRRTPWPVREQRLTAGG